MTKLNKIVLCICILAVTILGVSANIYLKNRNTAYAQSYCSENEGLEKIKQLNICKGENIKFMSKDYTLQKKQIYIYESDKTFYSFDPYKEIIICIITIEDAKQIAYSKVKEDIQNNWNSTYLSDFKDYEYCVTKMVFNGTQVWNVIVEGIKRFDGSEVEYTVKISCSNGQVIFSDKTY